MICYLLFDLLLLLIAAAVVAFAALYLYFQKQYEYWDKKNVPHGKPVFPFGNLQGANKENLGVVLKRVYDEGKHHRFYGIWQFHKPTLMVNDLDLIKRVLVGDFMNFHDHGTYHNAEKDPLSGM